MEKRLMPGIRAQLHSYKAVLDQATRSRAILVKAAGNQNLPAKFDVLAYSGRAIIVAAAGRDDKRASFSNYGEKSGTGSNASVKYVTVCAPGVGIYSAYAANDKSYVSINGTSMAAPHVSGLVALMKSINPDLTFLEVRDILITTGKTLGTDPIGPMIDARKALDEVERRRKNAVKPPTRLPPLIKKPPKPITRAPNLPRTVPKTQNPWDHRSFQMLMDLWLCIATPTSSDGQVWFYDRYGRALNGKTVYALGPPSWAKTRYKWLWQNSKKLHSVRHGTLYQFVLGMLKSGKFSPAPKTAPHLPPRVYGGKDARQLFNRRIAALKNRNMAAAYDLSSKRVRRLIDAERRRLLTAFRQMPVATRKKDLAAIGFRSVAELRRVGTREFIFRYARSARGHKTLGEPFKNDVTYTFGGVKLTADKKRGTLVQRTAAGKQFPASIVTEGGQWKWNSIRFIVPESPFEKQARKLFRRRQAALRQRDMGAIYDLASSDVRKGMDGLRRNLLDGFMRMHESPEKVKALNDLGFKSLNEFGRTGTREFIKRHGRSTYGLGQRGNKTFKELAAQKFQSAKIAANGKSGTVTLVDAAGKRIKKRVILEGGVWKWDSDY